MTKLFFIKKIVFLFTVLISINSVSQHKINTTLIVDGLIENVFLSRNPGLYISNIKYSDKSGLIKYFDSSCPDSTFSEGIVLQSAVSDKNYSSIIDSSKIKTTKDILKDAVFIEFDFYSETDTLFFEYLCEFNQKLDSSLIDSVKPIEILVAGYDIKNEQSVLQKHKKYFFDIKQTIIDSTRACIFPSICIKKNPNDSISTDTTIIAKQDFNENNIAITANICVTPLKKYHLKIIVPDVNKSALDTTKLFLRGHSFRSKTNKLEIPDSVITKLIPFLESNNVKFRYNSDSIYATIELNPTYNAGSFIIDEQSTSILDTIYNLIETKFNTHIDIFSYTKAIDNYSYYYMLSNERATQVAYYFITKGLSLQRIAYKGEGNYKSLDYYKIRPNKEPPLIEIILKTHR